MAQRDTDIAEPGILGGSPLRTIGWRQLAVFRENARVDQYFEPIRRRAFCEMRRHFIAEGESPSVKPTADNFGGHG